jgi:uncharacterized protein YceH (UPF0502 family)
LNNKTTMPDSTPEPLLSPIEARALGCLIEKELATPEYYPLTLNSLVNACNQKSNREPVMTLNEGDVEPALESLRQHRLAALFSGADSRVAKYKQTIDLVLPMDTPERIVLCELLLRGPQTPGELRTHCNRLHPFESVAAVDGALTILANRPAGPLVTALPRQPGQKETRFAQLLTGKPPEVSSPNSIQPVTVEAKPPPNTEERLTALETEVNTLREQLDGLRRELGN